MRNLIDVLVCRDPWNMENVVVLWRRQFSGSKPRRVNMHQPQKRRECELQTISLVVWCSTVHVETSGDKLDWAESRNRLIVRNTASTFISPSTRSTSRAGGSLWTPGQWSTSAEETGTTTGWSTQEATGRTTARVRTNTLLLVFSGVFFTDMRK